MKDIEVIKSIADMIKPLVRDVLGYTGSDINDVCLGLARRAIAQTKVDSND